MITQSKIRRGTIIAAAMLDVLRPEDVLVPGFCDTDVLADVVYAMVVVVVF